jgi:hypothetical protein
VDRVKWFRDRAARDCAQEEKEILEAEFEHTILSFTKMGEVWTTLAIKNARNHSNTVYAHRQAALYQALADNCRKTYDKAVALHTPANVTSTKSNVSLYL